MKRLLIISAALLAACSGPLTPPPEPTDTPGLTEPASTATPAQETTSTIVYPPTPTAAAPIFATVLGGELEFCDDRAVGASYTVCGLYTARSNQFVLACPSETCEVVGGIPADETVEVYCIYVADSGDDLPDIWGSMEPGCPGNEWFLIRHESECTGYFDSVEDKGDC